MQPSGFRRSRPVVTPERLVLVLSGESDKNQGYPGDNRRSGRESRCLPVRHKDRGDEDLLPSQRAVVNQVNHSTPELGT